MKNSRRNFLKLTSLSLLAVAVPYPTFAIERFSFKPNKLSNYSEAKELAKKAKKYFYKKEYLKAEGFYKKCIELVPANISFYDNLKAVYGAQGKYIDSIELFKTALTSNSQNLAFHDRTARCLMQLEIGNKKMATAYKNGSSKSLLKEARNIYKNALEISPEKEYLSIGLMKVKRKLREQNQGIDYRLDKAYKIEKKKNLVKHKKRFHKHSIQELENQLIKLDSKNRTELFLAKDLRNREVTSLREKIIILNLLEKKYRKSGDLSSAINKTLLWHNIAPKDSQAIKKLKRLYLKSKNYQGLIDFRRMQIQNLPNVWSHLGLIKAIEIGHRKGVNVSLEEITDICDDLLSTKWRVIGALKISILDNKAKNLLRLNKKQKAKNIYEDILKKEDIKSTGLLNRVINGYAITLLRKNEIELSKAILKSVIYKNNTITVDQLPSFISNKIQIANKAHKKQLVPLYCSLYRVYKKQGLNEKQQEVLNEILAIDTENKFVKKRS